MGNICSCTETNHLNNDVKGSPVDGIRKQSRFMKYDSDECYLSKLNRSNTRFIPIKHDQGDLAWKTSKKKNISIEDFRFLKLLGNGSFGTVGLVEKVNTGKLYAIKILDKNLIERRNQKFNTKAERDILQKMDFPFIVQLYYAFQSKEKLYLVMDFMQGGELFSHLRRMKKFTEPQLKFYAAEVILALEYLHGKGIIYRDLKPENILLSREGHIKITDFGLSKAGVQAGVKFYTYCGTPEYLAPEIVQGLGHDFAADWWSLGILIYEMASGCSPFSAKNKLQILTDIVEKPVEMKNYFSTELCSLLSKLLVVDPTKRLQNATEIKSQEFFNDIDWQKLLLLEIKPPFQPIIEDERDLRNFNKSVTEDSLGMTLDSEIKSSIRSFNTYKGFTYNPETNDDLKGTVELKKTGEQFMR